MGLAVERVVNGLRTVEVDRSIEKAKLNEAPTCFDLTFARYQSCAIRVLLALDGYADWLT